VAVVKTKINIAWFRPVYGNQNEYNYLLPYFGHRPLKIEWAMQIGI
jgi:hypothetical protein